MNLALLLVNIILLFYFTRMVMNSRKVTVKGKLGPTWIITVFFVVMGAVRLFQDHSVFSVIQTLMIVALGVLYSQMKSGFSDEGMVLSGNLYPWAKMTYAEVTEIEETKELKVEFTVKKVNRFVYFTVEQKDDVEAMLTRYEQERAEIELQKKAENR